MENFNFEEMMKKYSEYVVSKEKEDDKHLKGYMYDSLVYRYIRAREQMAEYEYSKDINKENSKKYYQLQANRDIMRFAQILDEAIGEHD